MQGSHTRWFELSGRELRVLIVAVAATLLTLAALNLVRPRRWASQAEIETTRERLGAPARLDINTAMEYELMLLPGVGEKTALAIVAHRAEHGRFSRLEHLDAVRGIGPKTIERLRPHVMCAPPSQ